MADMDLSKALDGMSDEELLALLKSAGKKPEEKTEEKHEPVRVSLPDGSVVEGASVEEVNKLLIAKLEEYRAPESPKPVEPPAKPAWDYDTYAKKFLKDPRDARDYMETAEFGFPVSKALPVLLASMGTMAKKLQELETQNFIDTTPDYEPSAENKSAIERVMTERNWQPSKQTYQDAFMIAKGQGIIKGKEEKPKGPQPPPRIPTSGRSEEDTSNEAIAAAARDMSTEDIEALLIKAGLLSRPHE